jgi:hypothetical protein
VDLAYLASEYQYFEKKILKNLKNYGTKASLITRSKKAIAGFTIEDID